MRRYEEKIYEEHVKEVEVFEESIKIQRCKKVKLHREGYKDEMKYDFYFHTMLVKQIVLGRNPSAGKSLITIENIIIYSSFMNQLQP